jgi:hypothetical protein
MTSEVRSMFGAQQYITVSDIGKVRKKDKRQEEKSFLFDVTMECPLTPELADDLGGQGLVAKLWDRVRGAYQPTKLLDKSSIPIRQKRQVVTLTASPEAEVKPFAKIEGVAIKKIRARKIEGESWLLQWQCVLGWDKNVADRLVYVLGEGIYATFEEQQGNFIDDEEKPKRGRGRPKASDGEQPQLPEAVEEGEPSETESSPRARRRAVAKEAD